MSLLELKEIVAGYSKELDILKSISLKVSKGQIVSIIGPNGAGKSTIFKTIFGITRIKKGSIYYAGEEITNYTPNLLLQKGLCFVPQGRNVFPLMTVAENIELGAYIKKNSKEIKNKIDYVYSIFPRLKNRKNQKAGSLSGGEMQMLEMGRALLLDPKLILLDEPSLGLSPLLVKEIFSLIVKINQYNHTAILMIEQNAEQSLRISHYAYVLEEGLNKYEGPAKIIRTNQKVKKLYLGG
jgi:ABC-type branched-subunit amino acid transport system ATPase component